MTWLRLHLMVFRARVGAFWQRGVDRYFDYYRDIGAYRTAVAHVFLAIVFAGILAIGLLAAEYR